MATNNIPSVCDLGVFKVAPGVRTDLHPGDIKFNIIAAIASLALDMLECPASFLALKGATRLIVEDSQRIPQVRNINESEFPQKIASYLRSIRGSFPHVVITDKYGMITKNGRTNKRDWIKEWNPKTAAVIEINEMLVDRLAKIFLVLRSAGSKKDRKTFDINTRHFRNLLFRLSITMAHELVHVYVLYLLQGKKNHTPPRVDYGGFGDEATGESGRWWEAAFFGGYIDMMLTRDDTRMEVVAFRDATRSKVWIIKDYVIDGLLSRDFRRHLSPSEGTLKDEDRPRGRDTQVIQALNWERDFKDPFKDFSVGSGPRELPQAEIQWLTGPGSMAKPEHTVTGQDLWAFAMQPRTQIRAISVA